MNDPDTPGRTGDRTDVGGQAPTPWWRSWAVLAPAVALVVGLVLGGLIVGAGDTDEESGVTTTETDGDTSTDTEADPDDPGTGTPSVTASVTVPQECLDAAETVEEATNVLREGVGAVRDFDRDVLVELLNQLEDLEAQARAEAATCSEAEVTESEE